MDFDQIQSLWKEVDASPRGGSGFEKELIRHLGDRHVRSSLNRLRLWFTLEIAVAVPWLFFLGGYLFDHWGDPRFAIPAALLHVVSIVGVSFPIRQLVALGQVDPAGPVVESQKKLAEIRLSKVRGDGWFLVAAPLLWVPGAIVFAHALTGLDLYQAFGTGWLVSNAVFGAVVLLGAMWLSRAYGDRIRRTSVWRSVSDGLAGRSLVVAQDRLAAVRSFEADG